MYGNILNYIMLILANYEIFFNTYFCQPCWAKGGKFAELVRNWKFYIFFKERIEVKKIDEDKPENDKGIEKINSETDTGSEIKEANELIDDSDLVAENIKFINIKLNQIEIEKINFKTYFEPDLGDDDIDKILTIKCLEFFEKRLKFCREFYDNNKIDYNSFFDFKMDQINFPSSNNLEFNDNFDYFYYNNESINNYENNTTNKNNTTDKSNTTNENNTTNESNATDESNTTNEDIDNLFSYFSSDEFSSIFEILLIKINELNDNFFNFEFSFLNTNSLINFSNLIIININLIIYNFSDWFKFEEYEDISFFKKILIFFASIFTVVIVFLTSLYVRGGEINIDKKYKKKIYKYFRKKFFFLYWYTVTRSVFIKNKFYELIYIIFNHYKKKFFRLIEKSIKFFFFNLFIVYLINFKNFILKKYNFFFEEMNNLKIFIFEGIYIFFLNFNFFLKKFQNFLNNYFIIFSYFDDENTFMNFLYNFFYYNIYYFINYIIYYIIKFLKYITYLINLNCIINKYSNLIVYYFKKNFIQNFLKFFFLLYFKKYKIINFFFYYYILKNFFYILKFLKIYFKIVLYFNINFNYSNNIFYYYFLKISTSFSNFFNLRYNFLLHEFNFFLLKLNLFFLKKIKLNNWYINYFLEKDYIYTSYFDFFKNYFFKFLINLYEFYLYNIFTNFFMFDYNLSYFIYTKMYNQYSKFFLKIYSLDLFFYSKNYYLKSHKFYNNVDLIKFFKKKINFEYWLLILDLYYYNYLNINEFYKNFLYNLNKKKFKFLFIYFILFFIMLKIWIKVVF